MRLISKLIVVVAAFTIHYAFTPEEIDYNNKALVKSLKKSGIDNYSELKALALPDSLRDNFRINGMFFHCPGNSDDCNIEYVYVGRVNTCRAGGCSIAGEKPDNVSSEYFDYLILFDENKTVQQVKVFNYQATHGYEIMSKGWLKQFVGHRASEKLQVDKDIDSLSGATISVYAITADIEAKTDLLKHKL